MDPKEIYADLKEKIIWLDLDPGVTLNLVDLAESYGVSRNPLTIALTRLEAEEWVIRQGTHFVVSPLTFDRIREITEIRSVLEVQANLWALHRITPKELEALKRLKDMMTKKDIQRTNREMIKLDGKFHSLLYKASKNNQLAILLDRMLCHYLRFGLLYDHNIDAKTFFNQSLEIIKAIEDKDEAAMRAASVNHIKESIDVIMGMSPNSFQPLLG